MRSTLKFPAIIQVLIIQLVFLAAASAQIRPGVSGRAAPKLATFGGSFEPNLGITKTDIDYLAHGPQFTLFLKATEIVLGLANSTDTPAPKQRVRMKLVGGNPHAHHRAYDLQPGRSNYFIGDQSHWRTDIPHYGRVEYSDVFPGITAIYHGTNQQLEYDFVLAAGVDPRQIHLAFEGVNGVRIAANGDLVLSTDAGEIRQKKPVLFQEVAGVRQPRAGGYVMRGLNEVGFETSDYDRSRPLVIDPVLQYSTYLGGAGNDVGYGIALDSGGNVYIGGVTASTNFPTLNAGQTVNRGNGDAFIAKVSAGGSLVYSTYIGGSGLDQGASLAVDSNGNAYLTGRTQSTDFPTFNAVQPTFGGADDAFVVELNAAGNGLVYSTYLGGSGFEYGFGLAVDASGYTYLSSYSSSTNFPVVNAAQPTNAGANDAIAVKIAPGGGSLVYATYIGGSGNESGNGITIDSSGNAYIFGDTQSTNLPVRNALQPTYSGGYDGFVAKLDPNGAIVYLTYIGGSGDDAARSGKVDAAGNLLLCGETRSTNFPTLNPIQATNAGGLDAFIMGLNPSGSAMLFSTYLGGSANDYANSMAMDAQGNIYLGGSSFSTNFPTVSPIQSVNAGDYDVTLTKINPSGTAVLFATYLGGRGLDQAYKVVVDPLGNAWLTGQTQSTDFPLVSPIQASAGGAGDVFIAKIATCDVTLSPVVSTFDAFGGSGSVTVTTPFSCVWSINSAAPWITFTAPVSGTGPSTVTYSVVANSSGISRNGSLTVGSASTTVIQSGGAAIMTSVNPSAGDAGTSVTVTLTGTNFSPGSAVNAGPDISVSNINLISATQMTATFTISANAAPGQVRITVTDGSGTSNDVGFTIIVRTQIRINAGSSVPYTDPLGQVWSADSNYVGGGPVSTSNPVNGTPTPTLYQTGHYGPLSGTPLTYQFPVPNGPYTVNLKFDENSYAQTGQRVFNVIINGQTVLANFDIFARAGAVFQAVDAAFPVNVTNGQISIQFVSLVRNPRICAIEILGGTPPAPALTPLSPASGSPGAAVPVTLTGTNFSTDLVINAGPSIAVSNVNVVSTSQITATFTIPANATPGTSNVTVTTAGGTAPAQTFTIGAPVPIISSLNPSGGAQGNAVAVTLNGSNFLSGASVSVANPGVSVSNVNVVNSSQITATFTIAANAALGNTAVTVTTSGTSNSATFTVNPPAPTLTSIAPASGTQGAAVAVTLTGTNFTSGATVAIGNSGVAISALTVISSTQITATFAIGANAALGNANVTVNTSGGSSGPVTFTINAAPPTVTGISPPAAAQGATTSVTLTGTNFITGASVAINDPAVTVSSVVVVSSTRVTATFTIGSSATLGAASVTVTTSGGTSGAVAFAINPPAPVLTSIAPTTGLQGSSVAVTLSGANFISGATVGVSNPGVTVSAVSVVNSSQITATFTVAANAALGSSNVTVSTTGGTSGAVAFTVTAPPPTLSAVNPSAGVTGSAGGVTLTGTNFITGATIAVSNPGVTVSGITLVNSTQITATFTIAINAAPGTANVTVTTAGGTTPAVPFTISAPVFVPIQINGGATASYVDPQGQTWAADSNYTGGGAVSNTNAVSGTAAQTLYQTAHWGPQAGQTPLSYQFAVPNGPYTVNLKFDENAATRTGQRVFNVVINGVTVLGNFDMFARTGAQFQAIDVPFSINVTTGQITIQLAGVIGNPRICAIEILQGSAAVPTLTSLSPSSGTHGASSTVTLTGSNFTPNMVLNAGPNITISNLTYAGNSQVSATFTVAAQATPGTTANVTVTTPGGSSSAVPFSIQ